MNEKERAEQLESLALDWIITQIRERRKMKETLPIEGSIFVPLEWAESLANYVTAPPLLSEAHRALRAIAAREYKFCSGFACDLCGGILTDTELLHEDGCPIGIAKEYIESQHLPYVESASSP